MVIHSYVKLPPIGAAVILGIELPGGNRFDVVATVAWTQDELDDEFMLREDFQRGEDCIRFLGVE